MSTIRVTISTIFRDITPPLRVYPFPNYFLLILYLHKSYVRVLFSRYFIPIFMKVLDAYHG